MWQGWEQYLMNQKPNVDLSCRRCASISKTFLFDYKMHVFVKYGWEILAWSEYTQCCCHHWSLLLMQVVELGFAFLVTTCLLHVEARTHFLEGQV